MFLNVWVTPSSGYITLLIMRQNAFFLLEYLQDSSGAHLDDVT